MNKKLIYRILGALSSALIILGVFLPFVNVTGYSTNLWETYSLSNSLYLPIMIIVFGAIGVIFFALNIKTEFAYMSTGAILFFIIVETIDIINQGVFDTLSIGYYFLIIGALVTGLMAFLTNLKSHNVEINAPMNNVQYNQDIVNSVANLPKTQVHTNSVIEPIPSINQEVTSENVNGLGNNINSGNTSIANPIFDNINNQANSSPSSTSTPVNPVVQEFTNGTQSNSGVTTAPSSSIPVNPVVQEFANSAESNSGVLNSTASVQVNPVIQDFVSNNTNISQIPNQNSNNQSPQQSINQKTAGSGNISLSDLNQNNTSSGIDIFGQPINKN